jgi:hypothetical protein
MSEKPISELKEIITKQQEALRLAKVGLLDAKKIILSDLGTEIDTIEQALEAIEKVGV